MADLNADAGKLDGTGVQGARMKQGINEYIYIQVPANTAKGTPLVVTHDGDEEIMIKGVVAATASVYQEIAVTPRLARAAAEFMWCQVRGITKMLVEGTTDVAKDDYLEVLNTETSAKKDATTRSVNSIAIACEAQASNSAVLTTVQLLGDPVIIAAS